ncbi:hypothetical protein [Brumimicrobium mesophilum]|uniref:hypothetical protein n=1 Tax=Brumimicrobium mesophilum TaxID=392717 RepID=UPI000D1424E8|nr:hypothetical protein [Brumimicrobium mesophilum]
MKTRKKIKMVATILLGGAFLFFATLVIHIGIMVYGKEALPLATTQIGRLDFDEQINEGQANAIENQFKNIEGVKSTYFNVGSDILIYTFDNRKNSTENIYKEFNQGSNYLSSRYTVSEEDLSKGCPAIESDSFYGKLTSMVSKIVN